MQKRSLGLTERPFNELLLPATVLSLEAVRQDEFRLKAQVYNDIHSCYM